MGNNLHGQLGIGDADVKIRSSPILVEAMVDKKPSNLACGANHTLACIGNFHCIVI